jgi:hypothetical protein
MDLTKLKLLASDITKFEFNDYAALKDETSSGVLKITLERRDKVQANEESMLLYFSGIIAAFEGKEGDESNNAFKLDVEFTMKYAGEFDVDNLISKAQETDWFFKKDAGIFLHGAVNRFLSNTAYNSVRLPYQQ